MSAKTRPPGRAGKEPGKTSARASRRTMIASTIAVLALLVGATVSLAAGYLTHRVQPGDTLSELAEAHGTSIEALVQLNGIDNPDLIVVDENLLIRPLQEGDDTDNAAMTHIVMAGDTLTQIAKALGVTVEELAEANGIANPDLIVTGEMLIVPSTAGGGKDIIVEADEPAADEEVAAAPADEPADDEPVTGAVQVSANVQPPTPASAVQAGTSTLHLVLPGETLDSIAANYGVSASQLLAANGHARTGVSTGMILKIPPADSTSVQLVGMPSSVEYSAVGSELTAVSVATAYWGSAISEVTLLEALEESENPHFGFRGDVWGQYGGTDDYGVYGGPLAEAIYDHGFVGEVFYADGDTAALTSRIDLGLPVVVWMTYDAVVAGSERIDDGMRPFTVVESKQAAVIYGYDDEGVLIVDLARGGYSHVNWADFMRSWGYFDGMGLAVSPI